ncbi:MAG: dihydrofolate reductase [Aerococcus sp.]|nr:dihydrofolate reductase [Aerococcus sp.]
MLIAIYAHDRQHLIGKNQQIPWHLPNDMRFFKAQTTGHPLIMGRTTFEGMGSRPLPHRENIVVTHHPAHYKDLSNQYDNLQFTADLMGVVEKLKDEVVYISGGAEIFNQLWTQVDELRITPIDAIFEGDTYFDPDLSDFECYKIEPGGQDEKNPYPYQFEYWRRRQA